jgi:hypothetical protein
MAKLHSLADAAAEVVCDGEGFTRARTRVAIAGS